MTTVKKLFRRVVIIQLEGTNWKGSFNGDDLHITFEVPFDSDTTPNELTVQIYNLSKTSIARIGKGMTITIMAGYEGDYGVLTQGKITKVHTYYDGSNGVTEIKAIEGQDASKKTVKKSVSLAPWTRGFVICQKIVELMGFKAEIRLPNNKQYKKGYVVSGDLLQHLQTVAKDCGATVHWRRGKLIIRSLKEPTSEKCLLSEDTGLIGSPEYFEEEEVKGYRAKCLLQHKICQGVLVQFVSRTTNGMYRARKGKHVGNGSEFVTEIEVI